MNNPQLPISFMIGAQKINIVIDNTLDRDQALGKSRSSTNEIKLCTEYHGKFLPMSNVEQTFWHEVVHMIYDKLGQHDMSSDEQLVQSFSLLLHQVVSTIVLSPC